MLSESCIVLVVTYNGLQENVGASAHDFLYVEANLYISSDSGDVTYTQQIVEMHDVPVCWTDGACPEDGSYAFSSSKVALNDINNNAIEGMDPNLEWNTTIVVEMYYNDSSTLVGSCVMGVELKEEGFLYDGSLYDEGKSMIDWLGLGRYDGFVTPAALLLAFTCFCICFLLSRRFFRTSDDTKRKEPLIVMKQKVAKSGRPVQRRQPLIQARVSPDKIGHGVSYEETANGTLLIVSNQNLTQGAISDEESVGYINSQATSKSTQYNASFTFSDDDGTRSSSLDDDYEVWSSVSAEGCQCMNLYEPPLEHLVTGKATKQKNNR